MGLLELRAHLIEEARTLGRQFGGDGKANIQHSLDSGQREWRPRLVPVWHCTGVCGDSSGGVCVWLCSGVVGGESSRGAGP
jgi:hypothetical protein